MKLSLRSVLQLLRSSRESHGWQYEFGRQIGSTQPGNPRAVIYRHVLLGVPPADFPRPLPGHAKALWLDQCLLGCHFEEIAAAHPGRISYVWHLLGVAVEEAKRLTAAAAEFHGHDAALRQQLLAVLALTEVPIAERPLPLIHPDYREDPPSPKTSSTKPSATLKPKVSVSVRRKPTTSPTP